MAIILKKHTGSPPVTTVSIYVFEITMLISIKVPTDYGDELV